MDEDEVRYMIAVLVRSPCRGGKYEVNDGVNVKIPAPSVVGRCGPGLLLFVGDGTGRRGACKA